MEQDKRIHILLENYKLISEETKGYMTEMKRCFIYAAVIIAIGLGYDKDLTNNIMDYMPIALLALIVYFLTLGFMYITANRYKAQVEYKINAIADEDLLEYELKYKPEIFKNGLLPIGKKGKRRLPLPNFVLGCVVFIALLFISRGKDYFLYILGFGLLLVIFGVYIFLVIPRVIERHQKRKKWIE